MLQKAEAIYHKANELVRRCGTRDTLRIASEIGIYIHQIGGFKELLGMYSYQHKERHILLNSNMDCITAQMVCGHEIGHDALHRDQAKIGMGLQEFTLFDMRNEMEYEANAFAAHLRIDSEELLKLAGHGYDVVQLSSIMETNVNSHRPNISSVISGYKQPSKSAQSIEITGFIEKSKPPEIIFFYTLLPLTA